MSVTSIEEAQAKAAVEASKSGQMSTAAVQTIVVVSGELEKTGEVLSMEIPVVHPPQVPEASVVLTAFNKVKDLGGIVLSTESTKMDFIPAVKFKKLHFESKKVSLAI